MHSIKPVLVTKLKGRSKSFIDDDVMLGQWPFVGHKFCSKYLTGYAIGRQYPVDRYSTVRLKKKKKNSHLLQKSFGVRQPEFKF